MEGLSTHGKPKGPCLSRSGDTYNSLMTTVRGGTAPEGVKFLTVKGRLTESLEELKFGVRPGFGSQPCTPCHLSEAQFCHL